ncbi:MAG: hypothetical protein RLZZ387_1710 [Chloroflexota bacterium]|jgi:hypothetical protein
MDEQRTANSSIDDYIASFRYQTIAATAAKTRCAAVSLSS